MTDLYIAGMPVILPENFSITITDENAFFTKNGTYTWDVDISLLHPQNAKVYLHLNRKNKKDDIPEGRAAYLVVDNEVVINGTEIILDWTDSSVKIQLASGSSELNFLIGGDRKLRDLDLGEAELYDGTGDFPDAWRNRNKKIYNDLLKTYPNVDWLPLPYVAGYDTNLLENTLSSRSWLFIGNPYSISTDILFGGTDENYGYPNFTDIYSGQVPQPFLLFIIRKVFESLGFSIAYNAIEDNQYFRAMYIVHGRRTKQFAKMLPGWTVVEFIEELENFFDCTFIIDQYNKEVRIYFNYQAGSSNETQEATILDEYTTEVDKENILSHNASNIAYDFDSDTYYRYMSIKSWLRDEEANYEPVFNRSVEEFANEIRSRTDITDLELGTIYAFDIFSDNMSMFIIVKNERNLYSLKQVEGFRPLLNNKDSEETDISLRIVPASMRYEYIHAFGGVSFNGPRFWCQIPVAADYDPLDVWKPDDSTTDRVPSHLEEAIENDTSPDESEGSKLRLAIYAGVQMMDMDPRDRNAGYRQRAEYPFSYVESLCEYFPETYIERYFNMLKSNPFRLIYLNEVIYEKSQIIDTTKTYKFTFVYHGRVDVSAIFVINNKKYRCVKIERTVTANGFDGLAKGEFYPYD